MEGGGGGGFITITPEDVTAHITQWRSTGAKDGQNRKSCQKRKTPEDSPRSEMCFCLHSNTQTAAATRGTRSNKAEREGSREGLGTLTTKAKKKGERGEKKSMNIFRNRANIKLVQLWVRVRVVDWSELIPVCSPVSSQEGATFPVHEHFELWISRHVALKISSTCYVHLHHAAVSHSTMGASGGKRGNPGSVRRWIACMAAQQTSIWQTLSMDSKRCQFETWTSMRKALEPKRADAVRSLLKTSANATSIQSSLISFFADLYLFPISLSTCSVVRRDSSMPAPLTSDPCNEMPRGKLTNDANGSLSVKPCQCSVGKNRWIESVGMIITSIA